MFNVISTDDIPEVTRKLGEIRGLQADDGDYYTYLAISYADIEKDKPFGVSYYKLVKYLLLSRYKLFKIIT